ncbi:MAG: DNA-binding response regulator [Clostridia bacterium]|jgi:two-component system response regulator YesN|nr:DNA-binding response regulator [Clostridia bacterium]
MIKLLIADDEYLVLDSLKMIISKNMDDVEIVGTASSGREAIEKALELKPDIIFMDIHMPGIDGIEAIKQIKAANSNALFVIITAYEFFDYAKEALNMGVSEYLLKPINKSKVIETLQGLNQVINQKRKHLLREVELKERINRILPYIEGQFISHQLFNIGMVSEIGFYEDIFNMKLRQGYAITVLLENFECKGKEDNFKLNLEKQNFYEAFCLELKRICPCLIGNPLLDRITAFIPVEEASDSYEIRNQAINIGKKIMERVRLNTGNRYRIGIGRKYEVASFNKSCNEAYMSASVPNGQAVMHFEDITPSNNILDTYPLHKESIFANRMLTGNINSAKEAFKDIYLWLVSNYSEDIDKIKSKLIDLLFVIEKTLPYKISSFSKSKQAYILSIVKTNNKEELEGQFMQLLSELSEEIQEQIRSEIDGIIPKVLKYLSNNYHENITLDDAAKSVNLSYHYFSKIFKDEVGKNFVDYLTELRIEKSMKILENHRISIKEVCHKIGYNDPNYYCKIFKKITGMTPTEYRAVSNIRGDNIG